MDELKSYLEKFFKNYLNLCNSELKNDQKNYETQISKPIFISGRFTEKKQTSYINYRKLCFDIEKKFNDFFSQEQAIDIISSVVDLLKMIDFCTFTLPAFRLPFFTIRNLFLDKSLIGDLQKLAMDYEFAREYPYYSDAERSFVSGRHYGHRVSKIERSPYLDKPIQENLFC